jgi:hypothetical protein
LEGRGFLDLTERSRISNMRAILSLLWRQTRNIDVAVYPKYVEYTIPFDHEPRGVLHTATVDQGRIVLIFKTDRHIIQQTQTSRGGSVSYLRLWASRFIYSPEMREMPER